MCRGLRRLAMTHCVARFLALGASVNNSFWEVFTPFKNGVLALVDVCTLSIIGLLYPALMLADAAFEEMLPYN